MNSCTRRRTGKRLRAAALALLLALAWVAPASAEDLATDLGGGFTAADPSAGNRQNPEQPVDMASADVVIGYVDAGYTIVNPIQCTEWDLVSVNQLVYEPVVDLDASMKPVPMLADSWTQEGRTWTFNLRRGILFHNGYELTAYDVVQSYQMLLAAGESNPYYTRLQMISDMQVSDIYSLQVEARYGGMMTLYAMNFPVMQYTTFADEIPRGTGPYWYIQYDDDGTIRLEANPLWWKRQPGVQSILLKRYYDVGDAIQAIQTNQVNMLSTKSSKAALSRRLANLTSLDYPTLTYEMLIPNLGSGSLLSEVSVRQAVMYAIDRSTIASNAYLDMAIQCEVPIPPSSWLYESQSAIYYYSPERALQLMNNLGWQDLTGNGKLNRRSGIMLEEPNVVLLTYNESTSSIRENAANLIAGYLEDIGFNVTVTVKSRDGVLQAIRDREYDLALVGVNLSEVPELSALLSSGGSLNVNRYSNDAMDVLLNDARGAATEADMRRVYSEIQTTVVQRLPILGLLFRTGAVLSSRSIGGLSGMRAYDNFNGFEFLNGA